MILYKYMSHDTAMVVLSENSLAFSIASEFNDPFETEAGYPIESSNPIEGLFERARSWGKRHIWTENTGILSLTRSPINPLMWSHYADGHRGVVIGVDVDAAGFTDEGSCIIPAQHGSIIYTRTRPVYLPSWSKAEPISIGHTHHYPFGHHEKLSMLFLQKPIFWSYEEEVRVAKCIADRDSEGVNASGRFKFVESDGRRLYCYQLPEGSIKEVFLGLRNSALNSEKEFRGFVEHVHALYRGVEVKACRLSEETWDVKIEVPYSN